MAPSSSIFVSNEFMKSLQCHKSIMKSYSVTVFAGSDKICLITSSNKWVIDSGAINHMTSNPNIFSSFRSHKAPSPATVADGSTCSSVRSGTVKATSSITLSFVLSSPNLDFNLIYVGKITRDLNCCVAFFPNHCLFLDLTMKQVIGKGYLSGDLHILDEWEPLPAACSCVVSPFEAHCRLGHPSLPLLKKLYPQFQNISSLDLRILRSDNAKEYVSELFRSYTRQHGILHQSACVDTPSQNGVAERKNRHLLDTTRALLFQIKFPKQFWADAVSTTYFLINRMPSSVLGGDMPYSFLFPNKSIFLVEPKVFGCTCYVRDVRPSVTKLDPKALKCICLGYSRLQKGFRCYSTELGKYLVSTDVNKPDDVPPLPSSSIEHQLTTCLQHLFRLSISKNWPLHQLDIKNVFLHGDLQEEVYIEQPPDFVAQGEYEKVCHLKNSLYGLKQSPRAWFETEKLAAKHCSTPMVLDVHLMKDDGDSYDDPERYMRLVGKLNYLNVTRPNIAFAMLTGLDPKLVEDLLQAFVSLLEGTWYRGGVRNKVLYLDPVQNLSSVASRSSIESEYKAMSQSTCEIMWIHHLLIEFGLEHPIPAKLWCGNQASLHIASNPVYHERAKHIEVDCHFIRKKI
ncbi:PREDICTED: uncharacterized protein LOC109206664 [Nicotiana attenuata]|uniref:uncharacterized protein LOC109206664 n=1 Tax=Nicotiana attenuata TaxID=49451 RepID=UPI0009058048|nr:PREDICTED: uncharacterized protein LOC109206664 [Nicotiana attenuata]